jgi:hypothetical protein
MKRKHSNFFWASYTDLMTSLFFIMLVLYVLTFIMLKKQNRKNEVDAEKFKKIQEIEASTKGLGDGKIFDYEKDFKRFTLKRQPKFDSMRYNIRDDDIENLLNAGKRIDTIINNANKKNVLNLDLKYLVVIEGTSSKDQFSINNELSYLRALSVFELWEKHDIPFVKTYLDKIKQGQSKELDIEIIIAGSGDRGVGRSKDEIDNQKILIQLIPKISYTEVKGK